jgi:hypothetical protein
MTQNERFKVHVFYMQRKKKGVPQNMSSYQRKLAIAACSQLLNLVQVVTSSNSLINYNSLVLGSRSPTSSII